MAVSPSDQVLGTTELVEAILLQADLPTHQLFVLQRVSKMFKGVIEGSRELRVTMFLEHAPNDMPPANEDQLEQWLISREGGLALWNPLTGPLCPYVPGLLDAQSESRRANKPVICRGRDFDASLEMSIFRLLDFTIDALPTGTVFEFCARSNKFAGRGNERFQQPAGDSWKTMNIARIPVRLKFKLVVLYRRTWVETATLTFAPGAQMGELADSLDRWYREIHRTMQIEASHNVGLFGEFELA